MNKNISKVKTKIKLKKQKYKYKVSKIKLKMLSYYLKQMVCIDLASKDKESETDGC